MISLLPLLIDEPRLPTEARDALVVAQLAADPVLVHRAKVRAARILSRELGIASGDLADLLGLDLAFGLAP